MNGISVLRNEKKFYINYSDYHIISKRISNIFIRDPNSGKTKRYHVRSIYFDNKSEKDYYDKIDGIEKRKKLRIRVYNCQTYPVKLEKKSKINKYIKKESILIDPEKADKLIAGDYIGLAVSDDPISNKIYYDFVSDYYRPVIAIDYLREAYTYGLNDIRVTFDHDLRRSEINISDLFNKEQYMESVMDGRKIIMEIKYNNFLPLWIKEILQIPRFDYCAISKYTLSRFMKG
jgi:hypothetical protein